VPDAHRVAQTQCDGHAARELISPAGLSASWIPGAGMLCSSLRHRGGELLGQCGGIAAYVGSGATMGIPLLHPWANRLARRGYNLGGARVEIPRDAKGVHDDANGLPIHGLMAGCPHWQVRELAADADSARLLANLDFAAQPELMALFPFPHTLEIEVVLRESTLSITTTLEASGDVPVPIAFGYHPYFRLPDVPREQWCVELPVRRRMRLDARLLPTGETETARVETGPLGRRVHDDLYTELEPEPIFSLAGGARRIEVAFGAACRVAIVHAPADDDVVCFEPMTAPTNPFEGGAALAWAAPGERFSAGFSITVR